MVGAKLSTAGSIALPHSRNRGVNGRHFRPGREDTLPWLLGVARNVLRDQQRSRSRRLRLHWRIALRVRPDSGEAVAGPDSGRLADALRALSEADRELILLIAWEGLTPSQAALVLGLKAPTARARLLRARRRLQKLLAVEYSESGNASWLQRRHRCERRAAARRKLILLAPARP